MFSGRSRPLTHSVSTVTLTVETEIAALGANHICARGPLKVTRWAPSPEE